MQSQCEGPAEYQVYDNCIYSRELICDTVKYVDLLIFIYIFIYM